MKIKKSKLIINMESCKQASELANSVAFNAIIIVGIIISATGFVVEIWVMLKITNRILLHQNTRILIITHQLWLILHCAARVFTYTYILVGYQKKHTDPCGYMMFPWECLMIRGPIILTSSLNVASVPAIVSERAIATFLSSKYENFGKTIAVVLIMAQTVIGIGCVLFLYGNFSLLKYGMMVYCARASNKASAKVIVVLSFQAAISFISALVLPLLFSINKRLHRNKIHVNLSHRYQIMENINSLQTLSPMVAFHALLLAVYMSAHCLYYTFNSTFPKFSLTTAIYLECVQLTPLYALTLPIAIVWTEKYVRKTVQENRRKVIELTGSEVADHYFIYELLRNENRFTVNFENIICVFFFRQFSKDLWERMLENVQFL
uniref:Bm6966, isoform c n=1 Tax=Brugia malayi TaxID=6279 RepID=A0A1I9FZN7_BRUMA|nr:Bm6966, isoform c [Brugia malayi]